MFKKFQWSLKNGIYNVHNIKSLKEINHRSANIYGYWYKIIPDPYIGEDCYIVWIDDIVFMKNISYLINQNSQNLDENIPFIAKEYLKLKRSSAIDTLINEIQSN